MIHKGRVLITDGVHEVLPKGLKALGYSVEYEPDITLEQVIERVGDYVGLVINSKIFVQRELLDNARQLKWIGRLGSGLEMIDQAYAKTCGVAIISSPEGNAPAVGEHALAMILSLSAKLREGHRQVSDLAWDREAARGFELKYKTVGIIGYGHTGPAFAKTLRGFENPVFAYDKYRAIAEANTPWVEEAADAGEVLAKADILSLHLPLTSETIGYLDATKLALLPPGAIVVNTSRGLALDLEALLIGLESGRIGGACLDVFPNEVPQTYSKAERVVMQGLIALPNVVMTPHVAGWTVESKEALASIVLERVSDLA